MRRFRSFVLDEARRQLRRDGYELHLTPKAFDMLVLLVDAAPRVVRKSELHDRLWPNGIVSDASLVGLVGEIRRALGDHDQGERIIRAVPRVGYAFDAPVTAGDAPSVSDDAHGDAGLELAEPPSLDALPETPAAQATHDPKTIARIRGRLGPATATGWIAIAATLVIVVAAVWLFGGRERGPVTIPSEYEQLTNLADSAMAPSLSPDGRMVTFKVGEDFFLGTGQIYVKLLPNGDSVQLTRGTGRKYGPVFTPDGSRVAYTQPNATRQGVSWDTYVVSVLGGEPSQLLPNASGLTWLDERRVLFAEVATGMHMGIVAATANRTEKRDIYWPEHSVGMAHYASASPDRRWVLVVEMDQSHTFRNPCRLVPFDGSSSGRAVGPNGVCTSASWSPDGRWMYFAATVNGSSHLWRQRFPDGTPEQITFGPTEEEGVAVAPDGRSVVTALGMRRSSIWIHDRDAERPLVTEGYSYAPRLSTDGTRVYYLLKQHSSAAVSELRVLDIASGRTETVVSGAAIVDYDISRDETEVAYTTRDDAGESQVWHASVNRRTPPGLIARNADQVSFGIDRDLIFRSLEGLANTVVRASVDLGVAPQRLDTPLVHRKGAVSPDGHWVIVASPGAADHTSSTLAVPVHGGPARKVCVGYCDATWSPDGRFFYVSVGASAVNEPRGTLGFPVPEDQSLPELPTEPPNANWPYAEFPGAHVIEQGHVAPGIAVESGALRYVFAKVEFHRNLFRIPIR